MDHWHRGEGQQDRQDHRQAQSHRGPSQGEGRRTMVERRKEGHR